MFRRTLLTAAAFASAAYAQPAATAPTISETAPNGVNSSRESYEAAYFAPYAPQTALDMVARRESLPEQIRESASKRLVSLDEGAIDLSTLEEGADAEPSASP